MRALRRECLVVVALAGCSSIDGALDAGVLAFPCQRGTEGQCQPGSHCGLEGRCLPDAPGAWRCMTDDDCFGWRCGPSGLCFDRLDAGATSCRPDAGDLDCNDGWRCGRDAVCHVRGTPAPLTCLVDEDCESTATALWRCGPEDVRTGRRACVDSTASQLRELGPVDAGVVELGWATQGLSFDLVAAGRERAVPGGCGSLPDRRVAWLANGTLSTLRTVPLSCSQPVVTFATRPGVDGTDLAIVENEVWLVQRDGGVVAYFEFDGGLGTRTVSLGLPAGVAVKGLTVGEDDLVAIRTTGPQVLFQRGSVLFQQRPGAWPFTVEALQPVQFSPRNVTGPVRFPTLAGFGANADVLGLSIGSGAFDSAWQDAGVSAWSFGSGPRRGVRLSPAGVLEYVAGGELLRVTPFSGPVLAPGFGHLETPSGPVFEFSAPDAGWARWPSGCTTGTARFAFGPVAQSSVVSVGTVEQCVGSGGLLGEMHLRTGAGAIVANLLPSIPGAVDTSNTAAMTLATPFGLFTSSTARVLPFEPLSLASVPISFASRAGDALVTTSPVLANDPSRPFLDVDVPVIEAATFRLDPTLGPVPSPPLIGPSLSVENQPGWFMTLVSQQPPLPTRVLVTRGPVFADVGEFPEVVAIGDFAPVAPPLASTIATPDGGTWLVVAHDDKVSFGNVSRTLEALDTGGIPPEDRADFFTLLSVVATPAAGGTITGLVFTPPRPGLLADGWVLSSGRLFQLTASGDSSWQTTEVSLPASPSGEPPLWLFSDGPRVRVGYGDGLVLGLPARTPLAPPLEEDVFDLVGRCGRAFALTDSGVWHLVSQADSPVGRWEQVAEFDAVSGRLFFDGTRLWSFTTELVDPQLSAGPQRLHTRLISGLSCAP